MAICNCCGHFCPDCEGVRYCVSCRDEYIRRLEEIEQAARAAVQAMRAPVSDIGPDVLYLRFSELTICLKDMERNHGPAQSPAE